MTESKICTCPSGDGSLRWPCPAHPAVDQADVAAKLTFINGRPAICGCQVEYSDGGGEYSDVIYVTLCAKHSGSAILDLVATNRIALTPEYEGQWHADLYLDREIPLAKVEGATPAEAVLALMSAERIDPEQESVEEAGGDERAAFDAYRDRRNALLESEGHKPGSKWHVTNAHYPTWEASRAALAQRSPVQAEQAEGAHVPDEVFAGVFAEWWEEEGQYCRAGGGDYERTFAFQAWRHLYPLLLQDRAALAQPSPAPAEAERPEVVARVVHSNPVVLGQCGPLNANDELMTVAQHAASVARWAEMFNRVEQERDAALARVADLEKQVAVAWGAFHFGGERDGKLYTHCETEAQIDAYILDMHRSSDSLTLRKSPLYAAPFAQAQHSVPEGLAEFSQFLSAVMDAAGLVRYGRRSKELSEYLGAQCMKYRLSAPVAQAGQVPAAWYYDAPSQAEAAIIDIRGMWGEDDCPTYEDVAAALRRLLAAAPAQAQHSVPDHAELLQALERTHAGHMVGHDQSDQPKGGYSDGYVNGFGECIKVARKVLAAPPAQARHSGPEEFSFEYRHPNGESHTVTVSRDQVISEMPDFLLEALCSKFCNCEPVGETNVVECCCDEYAEEFKLLAAAPGKEVPQAWLDVQAERRRQVEVEGYHGFRDNHYISYELSKAARAYIEVSWHALSGGLPCKKPESWPWMAGFKWSDGRTMLVKACALALAEIERLDRAAPGKEGV